MSRTLQPPLTFSATHEGRGGHVTCECGAGVVAMPIDMQEGGSFAVWLRGVRLLRAGAGGPGRALRPSERALLIQQLRAWLDTTERNGWSIDGYGLRSGGQRT